MTARFRWSRGFGPSEQRSRSRGSTAVDAQALVESFCRHLMVHVDRWSERGFGPIGRDFLARLTPNEGIKRGIDGNGDLLSHAIGKPGEAERTDFLAAIGQCAWYDPRNAGAEAVSGKLLRTIRLDPSDSFAFERAAEPGEWAVPGSFMFFGTDVASLKASRGSPSGRVAGPSELRLVDHCGRDPGDSGRAPAGRAPSRRSPRRRTWRSRSADGARRSR